MTVFVKNTNFQRNHIFSEEESTVLRGGQGGGGGGFGTSPFIDLSYVPQLECAQA